MKKLFSYQSHSACYTSTLKVRKQEESRDDGSKIGVLFLKSPSSINQTLEMIRSDAFKKSVHEFPELKTHSSIYVQNTETLHLKHGDKKKLRINSKSNFVNKEELLLLTS